MRSASRCGEDPFPGLQYSDRFTSGLDDVSGARAGGTELVALGLVRQVGVVIRFVRRVIEFEDIRVGILVHRILDRVGPHRGVSQGLVLRQDAPDLFQGPGVLQMQLGERADDAVSDRAKRVKCEGAAGDEGGGRRHGDQ